MFDFRPDCYIMASTAMFKGVMAMQSIVSRYVQEQCQMDMFEDIRKVAGNFAERQI